MKMLRFKFQQNHTINEKFDFWGVKVVVFLGGSGVVKVGTTSRNVYMEVIYDNKQ